MVLKAENIKKQYKSQTGDVLEVLKGIDLEIEKGEYIAILGASGAGKSTLLNILASLDKASSGRVIYNLDTILDISKLNDKKSSEFRNAKIGFIFQFHHLLPEFTAIENVFIPALIGRKNKKYYNKKAEELISLIGLSERKNHRPNQLSGGEQQRVAIARALINDPEIVFADEPTGNLDKKNSEIVLDIIEKLQRELNLTFVTATHSEIVAKKADKIFKIESGNLI